MGAGARLSGTTTHGRNAETPVEIPPAGWRDILWRIYCSIAADRIMLTAAGVTYYVLLALVPTLTAFVSIYGLFNNRASVLDQVELLVGIVPAGGLDIIRDQLTRLTTASDGALSITLIVSLAIALWSASAGVKAMFEAMNIAYHESERRSFIKLNGYALLFTICGALAGLLVVGSALIVPAILTYIPGRETLEWTVRGASYLVMLGVLFFALAALYRWGPSRENAKWRWVAPGTLFAVVALGAASVIFSWYVSNFSDYSAAYGSLGALIGLLTWIWISTTLVILGAEINSEIEHQTTRDSTTGAAKPLGQRGAHMADTVGAPWGSHAEAALDEDVPDRRREPSSGLIAYALPALALLLLLNGRTRR